MKKAIFISLSIALFASPSFAKRTGLLKDLDSLGSNPAIVERAKAVDGRNRIRVVQNRIVDRDLRFEFGLSYDITNGGDPYLRSYNVGYMVDFHITPKFSIGARYYDTYSKLTAEGERVFNQYENNKGFNSSVPDVDAPLSSTLGIITFYPLYGKLNFFNLGVTQFDVYVLGGYGQIKLESGSSDTWTAGGGVGIWWSQHLSSRLEVRYQAFEDHIWSGNRDQGVTAFSAGIGFLL